MVRKRSYTKFFSYAALAVVFLAVYFILPNEAVTNSYMMKVINEGFIYFIAVLGLSVVLGLGGQVTFSTAGIMGIGAYVSAILTTRYSWPVLAAILMSILVCAVFSFVSGLALFRLKGSYFAFASIALVNLIYTILQNWMEMTGGPDGISGIPDINLGILRCENFYDYFRLIAIVALVCGLLVQRIRKTYFGRALASVRDNEIAARCMGINPYRTKVYSFVVAGAFAGLAGAFYAFHAGYISPDPFQFDQSAIYLIMVMLGGVDSTIGAFIGSVLLTILPEKIRFLQDYYQLIYGIGVIILMVVMPMGIMGMVKSAKRRMIRKWKKRNNKPSGPKLPGKEAVKHV